MATHTTVEFSRTFIVPLSLLSVVRGASKCTLTVFSLFRLLDIHKHFKLSIVLKDYIYHNKKKVNAIYIYILAAAAIVPMQI